MTCSHPEARLIRFRTQDGKLGFRCRECGIVAIAGDSLWRTLARDIIRRLRRRP